MNGTKRLATLFATVLIVIGIGALELQGFTNKKQQEGQSLLATARKMSDIQSQSGLPFVLQAEITADPTDAIRRAAGVYTFDWVSKDKWREQISFPDFSKVTVSSNSKIWHTSNFLYTPYLAFQVSRALSFYNRLKVVPKKEKIAAVSSQTWDGAPVKCVKIKPNQIFCFDTAKGYLVREQNALWHSRYEYSDYSASGNTTFPHSINVFQGNLLALQIKVTNLGMNPAMNATMFLRPKGPNLYYTVSCKNKGSAAAKRLHTVLPSYPEDARQKRVEGVVALYADIGRDGLVRGLTLLQPVDQDLVQAAIQAISQWRYRPTACGGLPVDVSTAINVNFTFQ
ncbi:MAG: energy transducer TonB [Terriglobia bacterium]